MPTGAPLLEMCASRVPSRQRVGTSFSDEIVAGVSRLTVTWMVATFESEVPSFPLNVNWSAPEKFGCGV